MSFSPGAISEPFLISTGIAIYILSLMVYNFLTFLTDIKILLRFWQQMGKRYQHIYIA